MRVSYSNSKKKCLFVMLREVVNMRCWVETLHAKSLKLGRADHLTQKACFAVLFIRLLLCILCFLCHANCFMSVCMCVCERCLKMSFFVAYLLFLFLFLFFEIGMSSSKKGGRYCDYG